MTRRGLFALVAAAIAPKPKPRPPDLSMEALARAIARRGKRSVYLTAAETVLIIPEELEPYARELLYGSNAA